MAVAGVVFLYFLSIGPAYMMFARGGMTQSGFLSIYEPILSLRDRSPKALAAVFDWYMRLWHDYRPAGAHKVE